jgi:hypothetical protein
LATSHEQYWSLAQVLDWLTKARQGGVALFKDHPSALRDIRGKLIATEIRARGRHVTWDEGRIVHSGGIGLISADLLRDAEFIFHDGDWYLAPWGSDPFAPLEPNHDRWRGGASGEATAVAGVPVSPDFIVGFSDLQFRRDEATAVWPEPENASETTAAVASNTTTKGKGMAAHASAEGTVKSGCATRKRTADPATDAVLKTRIEQVHAAAKSTCDQKGRMLELKPLSEHLAGTADFSGPTIRQILNGTYPTAQKLGIKRFVWQPPPKGSK